MNMILISFNTNWIASIAFADSAYVIEQIFFYSIIDKALAMLCAKNDMNIQF